MAQIRLALSIAAAAFLFVAVFSKEGDHKIHLKGIQCNASEKYVFPNFSCFARSYSRTFSGLNMAFFAKKPLYDLQMIVKSHFKYGTIYREVLKTPKFDVCTVSALFKKDRTLLNRWVAAIIDIMEDTAPGLLHECPYTFAIINNRSMITVSLPSLFPTGDYKAIFLCFYRNEYIGAANIIYSISSENRDTFG